MTNDDSNISIDTYSDPDTEFHEILDERYMNRTSKIWDRGKISNESNSRTPECLRRLEDTVTNLESFLGPFPAQELSLMSQNTESLTEVLASQEHDDTLSDVDLEKFDKQPYNEKHQESISSAIIDRAETASLSDFHNVHDVLLNIRERLESFLKSNQENVNDINQPNLEGNIADLTHELERYVQVINEKKESELRKFSENMITQSNRLQMEKAFSRKEKLKTNIYETLTSNNIKYAIAYNASLAPTMRYFNDRVHRKDGFTMRNCYDNDYVFETYSDFSSVEYYTMLINGEIGDENLLNDAPMPKRDPENVIKQWQNYQLKTIQIKPKKGKSFKLSWKKGQKCKHLEGGRASDPPVWGFTLDQNQNIALQIRLEKERKCRYVCRLLLYVLSFICFVLVVLIVQSLFNLKKRATIE